MKTVNPQKLAARKQKALKLIQQGKAAEALSIAEQVCRQNRNDAESHYILGAAYGELKRYEEAAARFRACIELQPNVFAAYLNLGQACTGLNDISAAESAYRHALSLQPGNLFVQVRLAGILAEQGDLAGAEAMLLDALAAEPESAEALDTLGDIYRNRKEYNKAIDFYERALRIQPNLLESTFQLGNCLFQLGQTDRAVLYYQQVASLEPRNVAAHVHLGHCFKQNGEPAKARMAYQDALKIEPGNLTAIAGIIDLYEREGAFDAAYELLLPLVRRGDIEVELATAFVRLCHRYNACDEAVDYARNVLKSPQIADEDIIRLEYTLGRKFDQTGDFDAAFEHYRRANEQSHQDFDSHAHAAFINELIRTYNWQFFTQAPRATVRSGCPVFIIGMPRSGTSLTEQILASHPRVYGAGELTDIGDAALSIAGYPHAMKNIEQKQLDLIANGYLAHLRRLSPGAARITDKQPSNFLHLGLIALAFPDARIIHCTRNPVDNCLSIYFQAFSDAHRYANNLGHIGHYYRQYEMLMQHIKGLCGLPIMEVPYEALVHRQEEMTRKLLNFLDLEWSEHCLEFYKNERFVATPSYDQVRESIYTRAIGRWKNYEKHLQLLLDALER